MHRILALWAHPRSLSTALERVFIERGDFAVKHEPFSIVYYVHEQRATAVQASFEPGSTTDYASIRDGLVRDAELQPLFFKDMCYHCHDHLLGDDVFLRRLTNVFLIRDPKQTIASHFAKNPDVTNDEIGYEKQANVFCRVAELTGDWPAVVAAEDLQRDPARVLRQLCERIGLPDRPDALSWEAGEREEWKTWSHWHREVADSTSFKQRQTNYDATVDNHQTLATFYQHHLPFYNEMAQHRIGLSS